MNYFLQINAFESLFIGVGAIGIAMILLVIFLAGNKNFTNVDRMQGLIKGLEGDSKKKK